MKHPVVRGHWIVLCAIALLALGPSVRADTWTRAETRHFIVYSNIEASDTRHYLEQLEAFKYLAELILGTDPKETAAGAKFTIYLLGQADLLKAVRPETGRYVGGFYIRCIENAQAFSYAPQSFGAELEDGLRILLHEYAHHLMYSRMRRFYPAWYVEGFAEYLGATKLENGTYQLGVPHSGRINQLNSPEKWVGFDVMLDPKRFSEAVKRKQINGFQYYAQSWLLAHYMLSDSARIQAFNAYFDQVGRGEDGVQSFEAATGMKVADLRPALNNYRRKFTALRVKVPDLPETAVTFTRLPKERADYLLQAAALQACPNDAYAKKLTEQFRALRAKRPDDVQLRIELSRAELLFGDTRAARTELESLAASEATSFDVAYLLGRSYYKESQEKSETQLDWRNKASEQFLKAYGLNKTNAANLYFLSLSMDTDSTPAKSVVNASTAAAILAPSIPEYAVNAAMVNLRAGDRKTAARVLQPFASHPHFLDYATQVSALIEAIRKEEETPSLITRLANLGMPWKEEEKGEGDGKGGDGKDGDKAKDKPQDKSDATAGKEQT